VLAAKVVRIEQNVAGALIHYRRCGDNAIISMQVAKVIDCTGIIKNPAHTRNRALLSLFDNGLARVDPLCLGVEVDQDCAIIYAMRHAFPAALCGRSTDAGGILGDHRRARYPQSMCGSGGASDLRWRSRARRTAAGGCELR